MAARTIRTLASATLLLCAGCSTAGSTWMSQPLPVADDEDDWDTADGERVGDPTAFSAPGRAPRGAKGRSGIVVIDENGKKQVFGGDAPPPKPKLEGRVLGSFRNTYYDFPSEADHKGAPVALKNPSCKAIADVPRGFYEAVCVQGSGTLARGSTVSFAKRDCECAEVCPRTSQKICFDELDKTRFPWGRGAAGTAITPLLTVAVDSNVIPLGTPIYIPEYDGMPREVDRTSGHDGCFIAQDRGLKIKGKHVDIFTGHEGLTRLWNNLMPSNKGVTVVLDSPRCARASVQMPPPTEPTEPPRSTKSKTSE
jgi:3D (Asp-Asp-Asp) domain-containing protein